MAITKLMHMNTASGHEGSVHLKNSINYIMNENKTEHGRYIGSQNCHAENAYQEMLETKKFYRKETGRQGYHFIISFKPGEGDEDTAFDIARQFSEEYLKDYEVLYTVHNDKEHIHAHIVFNSVSFKKGLKYHYNDGDWEKDIQPIVDRLCIQHGVAPLEYHVDEYIGVDGKIHEKKTYSKTMNWNDVIRRDIDECIDNVKDFNEFIMRMKTEHHYRVNYEKRKYITVRAEGMKKARRLKASSIGKMYSEESIRMRIAIKNSRYEYMTRGPEAVVRVGRIPRHERMPYIRYNNMTPYQKERLKAAMIRRKLNKTNGNCPDWYRKEKAAQYYTTVENYEFAVKNRFASQLDVIKRYYNLYDEIKECNKQRCSIRKDIKFMQSEAAKIDKNSEAYENIIKNLKIAAEEAEQYKENIKNLEYEKYRCKRLLSDDVKELINEYGKMRNRNDSLERDIKKLQEAYENTRDKTNNIYA